MGPFKPHESYQEHRSSAFDGANLAGLIRSTPVARNELALWFLGQNGFVLKSPCGTRIAIDPYLTDSCRTKFAGGPHDLSRCLPIPIEPSQLEVDFYIATHAHEDHLDEETVRGLRCEPVFVAPWQAYRRLLSFGIPAERCRLLHPGQPIDLAGFRAEGAFALPTDNTDLNHMGILLTSRDGLTFYNTGDTAFADVLPGLLPRAVDVCAICINGKFNNLNAAEAVHLLHTIRPRMVIPTHYDMMRCNLADPAVFQNLLAESGLPVELRILRCGESYVVRKG